MSLLAALLFATLPASAATPFAGVAWRPVSRADLSWVAEGRTSGTAVGEFDGVVAPTLAPFGGAWLGERWGVVGSLGIARLTSTTWVGDIYRSRHHGVIRPEAAVRYAILERETGRPAPWLVAGVYGDIPSAREVSNGFTAEEQEDADDSAYADRVRLGGVGARLGAGVDHRIVDGLAIGATWTVVWHRSVHLSAETDTLSSWLAGDATLLLTFEWP